MALDRLADALGAHGAGLDPADPRDAALLGLLVHVAVQDGVVEDVELALLAGVLPGWRPDEVRALVERTVTRDLDVHVLVDGLGPEDFRWTALRFAARMAARDGALTESERELLGSLARDLRLPDGAAERAIHEVGRPPIDADRLRDALAHAGWDAADFAEGPVRSADLAPLVPEDASAITRVGVDGVEVLGLYDRGLVARFAEGAAWIPWTAVVGCDLAPGLGASVRLRTVDGAARTLVDARLAGLQLLIDRLVRPPPPPPSAIRPGGPGHVTRTWTDEAEG